MLKSVFHISAAAINTYTIVYDQVYVILPLPSEELMVLPLQARVMFLTYWCLMLQTIYYYIAILNDIYGTHVQAPKKAPLIRKVKDTLFSLAFPVAIFVSLAFWTIYTIDKEMIFPEYIERLYPRWVNHVIHTTVAVFVIIEFLSSYRNYPKRKTGLAITITFTIMYTGWLFFIYFKWRVWVYPMFDHLNWAARALFVIVSVFIATWFYIMGEKLNRVICASPVEQYTNGKRKIR